MRSLRQLALIGVLGSAMQGCGSDSTGPQASEIVGTWHATQAQATSVAHPANTINLITAGATLQIAFAAGLTYTTTTTFPGEAPEISAGTYTLTGSRLTLTGNQGSGGDVTTFDVALNNGTLVLTGAIVEFDFGTGPEDARLDVTLVH